MALVDGQSYEAVLELASSDHSAMRLIWIGPAAPPEAWRSFQRPLRWPQVLRSMDELFAPPVAVDLDLDFSLEEEPAAGATSAPPGPPPKRALIASASRDQRLYMRARLALADLTQADEVETGPAALEMARSHHYDVAFVDFAVPGGEGSGGWELLKSLRATQPRLGHLVVTKAKPTAGERLQAWRSGISGFFGQPPDPEKLRDVLQKV